MKVKTMHIEVKSLDNALKEAGEVFQNIAQYREKRVFGDKGKY